MKLSQLRAPRFAIIAIIAACMFLSRSAQAQTGGDTVYFDPADSMTTTTGGSGDFSTSDFWNPNTSTDGSFVSGSAPVIVTPFSPLPPPNGTNGTTTVAYGEAAVFNGPGSTVAVTSPVTPYSLQVGVTSGTETFGTTGAEAQISFPVGLGVGLNPITLNSSSATGTENVVFNSNVNLQIASPSYNGFAFNSYSSGNLAFNGGITFTNYTTDSDDAGIPSLLFSGNVAGSSFTINSAVTALNAAGSVPIHNAPLINLNTAGSTLTLTSNASFTNAGVHVQAGTILDQGANFSGATGLGYPINVGGTGQYLTDTAGMNVTAQIVFSGGGGTIGSALAAETTYSATEIVGYSGANMSLTSGAGGRVNFTGDVHNGNNFSIVKVGAGTVVLANSNSGFRGSDQSGGYEVQNGTLLVNSSGTNIYGQNVALTGSGLTIDNVATAALVANQQTYATLGGLGAIGPLVTAAGANSTIAPGDVKTNSGIGTLSLNGGLKASSGMTFDFDLNGAKANGFDTIAFNGSNLTLGGTVTFNFTNLGGALDSGPYTLLTGFSPLTTGGSSDAALFVLNAPAGYVATLAPGDLLPGATNFAVDFTAAAVPEPSTYAMIGLGMAGLVLIVRFRKLSA